MDGIIVVNKPTGITSFDVIRKLRKITSVKKMGHTGTLDPEASGVLQICIGRATGCSEFLLDYDKSYRAQMVLGSKTDTEDHTGPVIATSDVKVTKEQFSDVIKGFFLGTIRQTPPAYSAVKIKGKQLYKYAREGVEPPVEVKPREITIYSISDVRYEEENGFVKSVIFTVHCSKGTYIRTLCNDIGEKLGCYGHMTALSRIKAGQFAIESAYSLEEIEEYWNKGEIGKILLPCDCVFQDKKMVVLNDDNIKRYLDGIPVKVYKAPEIKGIILDVDDYVRIYTDKNKFIGLSNVVSDSIGLVLKPYKLFVRREEIL